MLNRCLTDVRSTTVRRWPSNSDALVPSGQTAIVGSDRLRNSASDHFRIGDGESPEPQSIVRPAKYRLVKCQPRGMLSAATEGDDFI